ncbi:MAG TPA: cadmium-translocating P-type ATPase [Enterococcus columbae]|nr:cadmium-translocating P-type ATPase [Enterococcus columbae]
MSNQKKLIITLAIGIIALIIQFIFNQPLYARWLVSIISSIIAFSMFIEMIQTLRKGNFGVDILAITAIVSTLIVGEYWASLVVLIMLTGGESLEAYASKQANKELQSLLDQTPEIAHVLIDGKMIDTNLNQVKIGQTILVKPNEMIPIDGNLLSQFATINEASLTGESLPVEKKQGELLMSGAINGDQTIQLTVTKLASDSQYQRLVQLVAQSSETPASFVRLADRYALPFTLIAYLIGGIAWYLSKDPVRFAEVMVVASPCPLILAAPIAFVAGMSRESRYGVVVKNGGAIEKLAAIQNIAFDKTGTLTSGLLLVDEIQHVPSISDEEFLQIVASLEQNSTHILARSIVEASKQRQLALLDVQTISEISGQGIEGVIDNQKYAIGKASFIKKDLPSQLPQQTSVFVAKDGVFLGYLTFKDTLRKEAPQTIQTLKQMGFKHLIMLTGDKWTVAKNIAKQVGLAENDVYAECLPETKITKIKETIEQNGLTAMVGDGINDAPALASASVGIAMGAHGATAASETADVVILQDDLTKVSKSIEIARQTVKIAKESVWIGMIVCTILMFIASSGIIPAFIGAMFQEVIDVAAIVSALRAHKN